MRRPLPGLLAAVLVAPALLLILLVFLLPLANDVAIALRGPESTETSMQSVEVGFSGSYLLRAIDLGVNDAGQIAPVEPGAEPGPAIFRGLFLRSFGLAFAVTALCVVLGYPAAYALTTLPERWARLGLALVLVPFWTSLLVRSTAWFILLQQPRFTGFAVTLAMVQMLLPFLILPLYAVMRRIDPGLLRAASSLGASGLQRFRRVYLPMTMQGVAAGALIVFMLSLGYYVTPALLGGQTIGAAIAGTVTIDRGMAAALSVVLIVATGLIVAVARALLPRGPALRRV